MLPAIPKFQTIILAVADWLARARTEARQTLRLPIVVRLPASTLASRTRASGGIGRRAGFRFLCPQGRGGSSPPSPTHCGVARHRGHVSRDIADTLGLRLIDLLGVDLERGEEQIGRARVGKE